MGQLLPGRKHLLPVMLVLLVFAGQPFGVQGVVGDGLRDGRGGAVTEVAGEAGHVQLRPGGVIHADQSQTGHI